VEQRVGQVGDRQVDDERAGGAAQSFKSATPKERGELMFGITILPKICVTFAN